ncbi:hypothetical protein OJ253_2999 [Cryptosporidium canis]|uniref:Uncharacterized protein n=1 Tax=Cryptosporidium canis TaxID=195482 RepID=A0A9D5DJH1_9CRYT|nr:hypothetical protein OJ253_2999 [Cryptosporidium canis]
MKNNIDLIFDDMRAERPADGVREIHGDAVRSGCGSGVGSSDLLDYSAPGVNCRQSVSSMNSNIPENLNKDLFDDLENELYNDSRFDSLKINDVEKLTDCVDNIGVGVDKSGENMISNSADIVDTTRNMSPRGNILDRSGRVEERRRSLLSNDQNSLTDDSMFNVNNSFGSNMANYSAYDSVNEISYMGSNQKIENHENALLNRMIDNQGLYNDINTMCETLSTSIHDNFLAQNKEIKDLSKKVDNIENKLNEIITLFETKLKHFSRSNNTCINSNNSVNHEGFSNNSLSYNNPYMQFNDRAGGGGLGGTGYISDPNHKEFGQNIGNPKPNQLFANNYNQGLLSKPPPYIHKSNIDRDDHFSNPNQGGASRMSSNSIRESQREAEKRAEAERLRKLEAERKKKEEEERIRMEEERKRQREEAERKLRADVKRKEIMDSLFASQTNDSSEKKPSLFGDESTCVNSRRNLFDD